MYLEPRMMSLEDSSDQNESESTTERKSPAVETMISLEDSSDQNDKNESEESTTTRPKSPSVDEQVMNSIEDSSDQNESETIKSPPLHPPIDMIPLGYSPIQNGTTTRRKSPTIDRMISLEDSFEQTESETTTTRRKPPVVGLVNLGNTCFMNATLQCLARTPNLLDRLMVLLQNPLMTFNGYTLSSNSPAPPEVNSAEKNELRLTLDIPQDTMIVKMTELLSKMTSGGNSPVNPVAIHNVVGGEFTPGMQHDSHELLRNIIDRMKRDQVKAIRSALLDSVGVSKKEAALLQKKNPEKANELKELDKKLHQKTIMDEIFGGELVTTRTCLVCNYVKTSREEFLDLSLPIRENRPNNNNNNSNNQPRSFYSHDITTVNRSLMECLQRFTEPEILEESNLVDCEKCHENNLNLIKSGIPVDQVFPRPPPSQESKNSILLKKDKGKYQYKRNNNSRKQQLQPPPPPPPLPEQLTTNHVQPANRRRRKKKTRADKIADDEATLAAATSAIVVTTDSSSGSNNTVLDDPEETHVKDEIQESDSQQDSKELVENENEILLSENEKIVGDKDKHIESSSSDMDMPELEKVVPDEGYAEDYKESDEDVDNDNKIKDHHSHYRRQGHHHINEDDVDDEEEEEDDIGDEDNVIEQKEEEGEQDGEEDGGDKLPKVQPTFEIPKSTKSPSRSQTMIVKPPTNLTIHLKRFTCGFRGVTLKLQDHVTFSEYIDVKEFVTTDDIGDGIRYRLYGIVEHSGSIHWGHYVAYVRVNNEWYYISDSCVSPSKLTEVINRSPYMLFYERVF